MSKSIYVGNLPFSSGEPEIQQLFEAHGEVESVNLIVDRESGRSRGFAFVEMADDSANTAIEALNDVDFGGRKLRVNEARPRH